MARAIKATLAVFAIGVALVSSSAFAQGKDKDKGEVKSSEAKDGYGYEFRDDPLAAGGFSPNDATIRVRVRPPRVTLIRPRTSFVPEMLKSVENI